MLLDEVKLQEQLRDNLSGEVRSIYLLFAHATLPEALTVRPSGHGFISRELRFEYDDKWYFSAVLNKSWILWYFRRPALSALAIAPQEIIEFFQAAEVTGQDEVKLRVNDHLTALAILGWIGQKL